MFQVQVYKIRFPGQQSWIDVDKNTYHSLKRRKGSKEKIVSMPCYHYLDIPFSWVDKIKKNNINSNSNVMSCVDCPYNGTDVCDNCVFDMETEHMSNSIFDFDHD